MSELSFSFQIRQLDVFLLRAPAIPPVQTSFGIMKHRPALFLRVIDSDGVDGWGEIWCNFPAVGDEHRARMARHYLPPLLYETQWESPRQCFYSLSQRLAVLALQSGEPGPIQQMLAGLDTALWDLIAQKNQLPMWRVLRPNCSDLSPPTVAVYASGINPTNPEALTAKKLQEGYRAFKLKVGFGADRDERNLAAIREVIGSELPIMIDANQAWDVETAIAAGNRLARYNLDWLEEPVPVNVRPADWLRIADEQPIPIAGGENVADYEAFREVIQGRALRVIQPDLGKWGGFSGCTAVAEEVVVKNKLFCPHWLGGAIGLLASMHLKAAIGGAGYVEVDANPNPLREELLAPVARVKNGSVTLTEQSGHGVAPDFGWMKQFIVNF